MSLDIIGSVRLLEEVKAGRDVSPLFRDLLKDYGTANFNMFSGAVSCALGVLGRADASGVVLERQEGLYVSSAALAVDFNRALARRDLMRVCELVAVVCRGLDELTQKGAIHFDVPAERPALRVEIVAQAPRKTTTSVLRDGEGEITETVQYQSDAVSALAA